MRNTFTFKAFLRSPLARLPRLALLSVALLSLLQACASVREPFKAYAGDILPESELALVSGDVFYRKDWLNSYVDTVRFLRVDGQEIDNSRAYDEIHLAPGDRELEVYYSWDMGTRIGLAPAMVSYAETHDLISGVLHLEVRAGEKYTVKMKPVFSGQATDIRALNYVDFWVEDATGRIVSRTEYSDPATNS
jgi:hypothetical protein